MRRIVLDMQCNMFADDVKIAKKDGLIDNFIYASISPTYLAAVLDTL